MLARKTTGEVRPDEHQSGFPGARRRKKPPLLPKLGRPGRRATVPRPETNNLEAEEVGHLGDIGLKDPGIGLKHLKGVKALI